MPGTRSAMETSSVRTGRRVAAGEQMHFQTHAPHLFTVPRPVITSTCHLFVIFDSLPHCVVPSPITLISGFYFPLTLSASLHALSNVPCTFDRLVLIDPAGQPFGSLGPCLFPYSATWYVFQVT